MLFFFFSSIYSTAGMPMVVVELSPPKVSVGLSPFSLGLPAPCYLTLATAPATGPSPLWPTSLRGVCHPMS